MRGLRERDESSVGVRRSSWNWEGFPLCVPR